MKILILSCNTGGGHNSAAAAMKEYFDSVDIQTDIRDALAFKHEIKSKIISRGHVLVYKKAPQLFGAGYRYLEQHPPKPGQTSMMYDTVKKDSEELYEFLNQNQYDLILCTHIFAAMIVTEMKKNYAIDIKNYLIITDYTCYPGVGEIDVDRIFIPHADLICDYVKNGILKEKLMPLGIPVKSCFYQNEDKRAAKIKLGLDETKRMVLMMCGSMGCGPLAELAASIIRKLPRDAMLVVICGNNEKLMDKLLKEDRGDRMHVVGFTDKISWYMDAATVVLTKPGGLSATETATKGVPMILIDAVPGCETKNMDFFTQNGFALTSDTSEGLSDAVIKLLTDERQCRKMIDCQNASFSEYAAEKIGSVILSEVYANHG